MPPDHALASPGVHKSAHRLRHCLWRAQEGAGGHAVYVAGGGRAILEAAKLGAAVAVTVHNTQGVPYKGVNLFATDHQYAPLGDWPASMQPEHMQVKEPDGSGCMCSLDPVANQGSLTRQNSME